jgi:molybdate transport system substrate-binding protein
MRRKFGGLRRAIGAAAICLAMLAPVAAAPAARGDAITVSAAISLKDVLGDIAKQYQADTGQSVSFNFGASGTLAVQIQQGAPVDLFISAGVKQVDTLVDAKLADADSRVTVATNSMVLIVPKDQANPPTKFEDLSDARFAHIAVGKPKVVPAGDYAMQVLKFFNLEEAVTDRLEMGSDVRQVLLWVSHGEADAGLVYATDAAVAADSVKIALVAPEESHKPIVYPAVIISSGHKADAQAFLQYLLGPKGKAALLARGFGVPVETPSTQP